MGRFLTSNLEIAGSQVRRFDLSRATAEDTRDVSALSKAIRGVTGIVHLAAMSRVVWAERDPAQCQATNVEALRQLLRLCLDQICPPWVIFASSREVYGSQAIIPVDEDSCLSPVNVYGQSKALGEELVEAARDAGLVANICRLSNVYGCPLDHADRVAMAFARAAAQGGTIRVEGSGNIFDFTAVRDVTNGIARLVEVTAAGECLPPIHFVSGKGTTLGELAAGMAASSVFIEEHPPRSYDVSCFVGEPTRAARLLGWRASTDLCSGMAALIAELSLDSSTLNSRRPFV